MLPGGKKRKGVSFPPRAGGNVRIFVFYNNKQTNKQTNKTSLQTLRSVLPTSRVGPKTGSAPGQFLGFYVISRYVISRYVISRYGVAMVSRLLKIIGLFA